MTLQRPDLVKTVTFVDSNTLAPGVGLNDIVLANPPGRPLSAACQRWVIEKYSYSSHHITDDWIDEIVKIAKRPEYEEARKIITDDGLRYTQFMPLLAREKLQMFAQIRDNGLQRPTNLIWGLNDPTAPVDMCRALFDLCALRESKTQMHIINQAGHFSFREHPEEFNACLTGFIEGVA
jgi:pimeloyl-ACP methyl ester carboxylesterase